MRFRHQRPAVLLAMLAVTVGLAGCSSSDAVGDSTPVPVTTDAITTPVITEPATTVPQTTLAPDITTATAATSPSSSSPSSTDDTTAPDASEGVVVTDAEVADLEKQLDEIDQLLAGVDADLSQD
jgi:hypothetical protein